MQETTASSSSTRPQPSLLTPIASLKDIKLVTVDIAKQQIPVRAFQIRPFFDSTSKRYAEDCPTIPTLIVASASYYVRTKTLSPEHYQELIDRGWRRSGTLLYLPDASRSCCVHYTIRLPVSDFKPTKDQRQALNRWNRFVLGEDYIKSLAEKYPKSKAEKKRMNSEFDFLQSVHESESNRLKSDIQPQHRFEVQLEPDTFTEEKYELYSDYQRHVHHDDEVSKSGFKRFLCASPLSRRTDSRGRQFGSYHQCYRLDGRLIAMGVLDLLPHAVSGVYFIYHKDVEQFSFGKLSALREAALALEQDYTYYYMGYYIHSCRKMRYKGDYKPQYVLDLHDLSWQLLDDQLRALMEAKKYASRSKENTADDSQDDILHPVPVDAMGSGLSVLQLGLPGCLRIDRLLEEVDLDSMKIFISAGVFEAQNLVSWSTGDVMDPKTLKGAFAELAAATGPMVAEQAIVDFS